MVSELLAIYGATLNKVEAVGQEGAAGRNTKDKEAKAMVQGTKKNKKEIEEEKKWCHKDNHNEEEIENHLFTARQEEQETTEEERWRIDSGCTNHMTPNEKIFVRLNTNINVPIRVGNGAVMISKGKGDIKVMTKKGKRIIRDVLLVPNLGKSLLSNPQIIKNGYQVTFKRSKCIIHDQAGRKI